MGWWSEEENGTKIMLGDGPMDTALSMMSKIVRSYKREVGRKPTPREVEKILEATLSIPVEEWFDGVEVTRVVVETRKATKPKLRPGDHFAVPLSTGGYGYGRIKGIFLKVLVWVEFFNLRTELLVTIDDLHDAPILGDFEGGYWGLVTGEWPVLGNRPLGDISSIPLRPLALVRQPITPTGVRCVGTVIPGRTKKGQFEALQLQFPVGYPDDKVRQILEWRLAGNEGLPWQDED